MVCSPRSEMERDMVRGTPQIAVLMSVYNGETYLAEAVESILDQTFSDFIFLILDDASTDATPEMLKRYATQDNRVIILTNESNLGLTASLNKGLSHIDTPYVARMDADDISYPERLARQWAFMHEHPDVVALGCACQTIDASGMKIDFYQPAVATPEHIERGEGAIAHPTAFIRTAAIREIGGYREQFSKAQDADLWLRFLAKGYRLANLDGEPLLDYRCHERSATATSNALQAVCHVAALLSTEYIRDRLPDPIRTGTVIDVAFICDHLRPGRYSAFLWFRLLAWRNIPVKERYIAQALAFSISTLLVEPTEELVLAWRYFRRRFPVETDRIIVDMRARLIQQGDSPSLALESLEKRAICLLYEDLRKWQIWPDTETLKLSPDQNAEPEGSNTTQAMPDISVIIPVYSTEPYLERCLDCVVEQTHKNIEIIVVNDGSPGNCEKIVKKYQEQDKRIQYIAHESNRSLMQSRITGVLHANGKYVLHLDADDMISTDTCEKTYNEAKKQNADVVHYRMLYGESIPSMVEHFGTLNAQVIEDTNIMESFLQCKIWWTLCGKLIKRSIFIRGLQLVPFNDNLHINSNEDLLLFFPICCLAHIYIANPDSGTYYYHYFPSHTSLTKSHFAGDGAWFKCCFDLKIVRESVLAIAQKRGFSSHDIYRLEKRLLANFSWYAPQVCKLDNTKKGAYYAALLETTNQGIAAHSAGQDGFEILCQSAVHIGKIIKRPSKIKHIAIVVWGLRLGGAERVACLLTELLQKAGFKVTFFTDEPQTQNDYPHTAARVILSQEPAERWNQVQTYCRSLLVDVCLFVDHFRHGMLYDLLAAKLAGCLVIPWEHNNFFFPIYADNPVLIHWRDKTYRAADAIACLSDTYADFWKAAGHNQAVGLPNLLTFDPSLCPRTTGQEKNIIFIGRLCDLKGAKTALHVFAELRVIVPEARMVFLGRFASPDYEMECYTLAQELNIMEHIGFEGHVTDISSHLAHAAVHIMPSQCEGSPMALMEAKAHGVPSVLFEMQYLDLVSEEYGCVMVGKNDKEGMIAALFRLLQDHQYWQIMSDRARGSLALIDKQDILRKWQKLFADLDNGGIYCNNNDPAYVNQPSSLFKLAIREIIYAIPNNYIRERQLREQIELRERQLREQIELRERECPRYLLKIQYIVDKFLPSSSRRRYCVKVLIKNLWGVMKKLKNIKWQFIKP